jgi:DnaA-homolog protein
MQQQLLPGFALPPAPALENFVIGRNLELVEALRRLSAGNTRERFFYLWGESGCGKSHLLQAVAGAACRRGMAAICSRVPADCADFELVALDDADRLDETAQIELFNLYNRLREGNGCLLASGTLPPAQLAVRPDLATRLGWGLVFRVHGLNDEEKTAALAAHAELRGFTLPAEVSGYLLRHWRRDLPALMGVLEALDRYSMERQRAVSVPLLRELLNKLY